MQVDVVQIGNSRGIRIPSVIIKQLAIRDRVELKVQKKSLNIKPVALTTKRSSWESQFQQATKNQPADTLQLPVDIDSEFDWEWE